MTHRCSGRFALGSFRPINHLLSASTPRNTASRARSAHMDEGTSLMRAQTFAPKAGHFTGRSCACILEQYAECCTAHAHRSCRSRGSLKERSMALALSFTTPIPR